MQNIDNHTAPPLPEEMRCQRQHCFFWLEKGDLYASGLHKSLEAAIGHLEAAAESRCDCSAGDLRYPVSSILEYLAAGDTVEDILAEFTDLEFQDILACFAFAALATNKKSEVLISFAA